MATWVPPMTWPGTTPTAITNARLNTIRDNLNHLYSGLQNITASTFTDSGVSTRLHITRSGDADIAFSTRRSSHSQNTIEMTAGGKLAWGSGSSATDLYIVRNDATYLRTNAGILVEHASGGTVGLGVRVVGDSVDRVGVRMTTGNLGVINFSFDGDATTARMRIADDTELILENPASPSAGVQIVSQTSASGGAHAFAHRRSGTSQPRAALGQNGVGNGAVMFGDGASSPTDLNIGFGLAGRMNANGMLYAVNGIATRVNAGAFANSTWENGTGGATAIDGLMGIDSSNGRIYFRYSGAHHFISQTAGFVIPEQERNCPQCGEPIVIGERVVGRINEYQSDEARHGLWEHETCS